VVYRGLDELKESLLELADVHYTYPGGQQALKGLSMRVPASKKCAVIGHNGCGKSTLFLHANGLVRPQQGAVYWKGSKVNDERRSLIELRQKIGLVFQDPEQQLVAATVEEDISFGLYNQGMTEAQIQQRVRQTLADFGLLELAKRPVHHLSLGQKKKLSLAGVMALQPELLVLDEPTAYLDRLQSNQLMQEIGKIHQAGTTVLMATHDLDLVLAWADWVFVMQQGQLVLQGEPQQVFLQRSLLKDLQLGVPLLIDAWESVPESIRGNLSNHSMPRTIEEFRERLQI
jgi:cobalt/nickel transport system ATP-binding protein